MLQVGGYSTMRFMISVILDFPDAFLPIQMATHHMPTGGDRDERS